MRREGTLALQGVGVIKIAEKHLVDLLQRGLARFPKSRTTLDARRSGRQAG